MKRLIFALCILGLYMFADTALTTWGLGLGLREANPWVNTDKLVQHAVVTFAFVIVLVILMYWEGKRIDREDFAHKAVLGTTLFYVYVLFSNLYHIWGMM